MSNFHLDSSVRSALAPSMAASTTEIPGTIRDHAMLPSSDAEKSRYNSIAENIAAATKLLRDFPKGTLNFSDIGYFDISVSLFRGQINFSLACETDDGKISGHLHNIGNNSYVIYLDNKDQRHFHNYSIGILATSMQALAKMKTDLAYLFPDGSGAVEPPLEPGRGGNGHGPTDHPRYREFVARLIDAASEIIVNPRTLGGDFVDYQIYSSTTSRHLAYCSSYGNAAYISPRSDDFRSFSKQHLRTLSDVTRVPRPESENGANWPTKILEAWLGQGRLIDQRPAA